LFEDENEIAPGASFSGHATVKPAPKPARPANHVPPEPTNVGSLLTKPARTCRQPLQAFFGETKLAEGVDAVARKIKAIVGSTDESLLAM